MQTDFADITKTGHILGEADQNSRSVRQRDLSGLEVAVTRC